MAGIYIHIPFCKQACHYCDFHFSTNQAQKQAVITALHTEMQLQAGYLQAEPAQTLYLGGGTPSLLSGTEIQELIDRARGLFNLNPDAEITLEANPDDLTPEKAAAYTAAGVNRLSIGIQSFSEEHLRFMNRAHNALQSVECVSLARQAGIHNLSIDLIYGLPGSSHAEWQATLQKAVALQVPHISAYCLTVEPKTVFGNLHKKGQLPVPDPDYAAEQFEMLVQTLAEAGIEQYEISNFARPGFESRHNSAYWEQKNYLGIGPSAHSYNGTSRQFNISSNAAYVRSISEGTLPATLEPLSRADCINDYLLTTLRTRQGCNLDFLLEKYGHNLPLENSAYLNRLFAADLAEINGGRLILSPKGRLLADGITAELMV